MPNKKIEFPLIQTYVPVLLGTEYIIQFNHIDLNEESQFKFGPGKPQIICIK